MKTLRLANVAAQAERIRLRHLARRTARRAGLFALAACFLGLALLALHVAAYAALARCLRPDYAGLILAAADLLIGLVLLWIASRASRPDAMEREAKMLRDEALAPLFETASLVRLLMRSEGLWLRLALAIATLLRPKADRPR